MAADVSAEKRTRFDGWLAGICASRVFNGLVFMSYAAALSVLQREWGMSAAQAVERQATPAVTKPDGGGSVQAAPLVLRVVALLAGPNFDLVLQTIHLLFAK